jgi:hypothetical protein
MAAPDLFVMLVPFSTMRTSSFFVASTAICPSLSVPLTT